MQPTKALELELVLQALPMQLAVLEHDGTIVFVNAAWQTFARENGAAELAETSVGRNYLAVCDRSEGAWSERASEARLGIAAVLAGTLPHFTLEYPCHSPTERRWFLLYAAPLPGRAGRAVVAHLNITGRKLLEERVVVANQELRDFMRLFGHEIRTPLTSITGYVQLAQQHLHRLQADVGQAGCSPERLELQLASLQQSLEQAQAPTRRLNRLLTDLAEVAQDQSDGLTLQRAPCELGGLVWEVVQEQQLAWPGREIVLRRREQAVGVQADRERIGQVVTNFLTNTLKYAPADRPIEVRVSEDAGQARVEVRDQGPGLYLDQQERIWERWYRLPDARTQEAGGNLGLGLYLCRSIIQAHGGQTGVESTPGAGATFWFTLPV